MKKVFTVKDSKADAWNQPFFKSTHGEAERDFRTLVNDNKSLLSQYPEDFDLYYLGEYDEMTGKFITLDTPQHVIKAVLCVAPKAERNPAPTLV